MENFILNTDFLTVKKMAQMLKNIQLFINEKCNNM